MLLTFLYFSIPSQEEEEGCGKSDCQCQCQRSVTLKRGREKL